MPLDCVILPNLGRVPIEMIVPQTKILNMPVLGKIATWQMNAE